MGFWLALGVRHEETDKEGRVHGSGWGINIDDVSYETLEEAVAHLPSRLPLKVGMPASEATAYVVEAATSSEAGDLVKAVYERGTMPHEVRLVQRDIPTERMYHPIADETSVEGAFLRLLSEVSIAWLMTKDLEEIEPPMDVGMHREELRDFSRTLTVLIARQSGNDTPTESMDREPVGQSQYGEDGLRSVALVLDALWSELPLVIRLGTQASTLCQPAERGILEPHMKAVQAYLADVSAWRQRWPRP